jgi:hypothetical protein
MARYRPRDRSKGDEAAHVVLASGPVGVLVDNAGAGSYCKVRLRVCDRYVIVQHLEQSLTYGGLIEGKPSAPTNDRYLEHFRSIAASRGA